MRTAPAEKGPRGIERPVGDLRSVRLNPDLRIAFGSQNTEGAIPWVGLCQANDRDRVLMQLHEVESNVADLDLRQGFDLIFDLLRAYGVPSASITRLQKGTYDRAAGDDEVLWTGKVYYRYVTDGDDVHAAIDAARHNEAIARQRPRFIVIRNEHQIVAVDTRTGDTLDTPLADLSGFSAFFLPWAGIEKTQLESVNYADVKAAAKMARLYDEIVTHNHIETADDAHRLNIFFSRLLFCFFAEDTGVFRANSFTNGIASSTSEDGSDTGRYLDELFGVLDLPSENRKGVPAHFAEFGYVNGKLFAAQAAAPQFTPRARRLVLECGTLNWSAINPDIFGSMMQAVVHAGQRESLGMHYTSVENIMKVIRPLFLDDLQDSFDAADTKAKLMRLHERIGAIKCFDPACGSGNFLVIAYKELRKLEHRILKRLQEVDPRTPLALFQDSHMKLENFYGIEIDDFACEIAILSLWLAKHQMNVEFRELFGHEIRLIPLRDTGNVVCANATRIDWDTVCPARDGEEVYLLSNPPYQGGTKQTDEQKADLVIAFGDRSINRYLDYVSAWLIKGARFVVEHDADLGFVTTNSVTQGNHVGLLWPHIHDAEAEIGFAYTSFRWSNSAKGNAGVTCVIIGLTPCGKRPVKWLYTDGTRRRASVINSYLVPDVPDVIVTATDDSINPFPKMAFGSMPRDGGHLILTRAQRDDLLQQYPQAQQFVKRYIGADELLKGGDRFCIWVAETSATEASEIALLRQRFELVRAERMKSNADSTRQAADTPYRFVQVAHRAGTAIVVPLHSSEGRDYIPMGFVDDGTVVSNACGVVYDAGPWLFALLTSRMHNVWVRAVAGALETRIRYSATLCYNTFPVPALSDKARELLTERAFAVLAAREQHADKTLAQLYDPEKMPAELRAAHQFLDAAVDQFYRKRLFQSDDERLEMLFDMYEAAVDGEAQPTEEVELIIDA